MPPINKSLLRLAAAIGARLARGGSNAAAIELPTSAWERCEELVRQIRRAELRNWQLAAAVLRMDLRYAIASAQAGLMEVSGFLPNSVQRGNATTTSDIYQDLLALHEEFERVEFDLQHRMLHVTTESIELQGIYLGPFEIQLDWGQNPNSETPNYRVIAKDPHPAESRDSVTHPHVCDETLCEGEGRQAIRQALSQGRLFDFFALIASVLRNYNRDSPFVELALWYGTNCVDCGSLVSDQESYACQRCSETLCDGCEVSCRNCEDSFCGECASACAVCQDNYCLGCMRNCQQCRASVCAACLKDNERCPNCHELGSTKRSTHHDQPAAERPALQPHGMGQAAVPA